MSSEQETDEIKRELSTLSCPFTWQLTDATTNYKTKSSYANITDDNIDEEAYLYLEKLISCLVILYEKILFSEIDCARKKFNESEELLLELQERHEDDDILRVIEHIFYSTICHYLFEIKNMEELKINLPKIIKTSDFTKMESAALAGCKSVAWSMYGDYGRKEAIDLAEKAIQQNPDKALWQFILAKNLRRNRRVTSVSLQPSKKEERHYRLAYEKSPNPVFGMHYARMYRECIQYTPFSEKKNMEIILLDLYKKILQSSYSNYRILLKLALGFIRLKTNPQYELAKDCLDKVENILSNDNSYYITYLHYRGIYLEKIGKNKEALEFYKKSGERYNYVADWDYIRLGYKKRLLDPLTHFLSLLEKYEKMSKERNQDIYLAIATCYYEKRDWKQAMEYYLKAILEDPKNTKLKIPYHFGNTFMTVYKNGIYGFLKLELLHNAGNFNKDETFIALYNKLQELCNLHDQGLDTYRL